jgi:hypothetical protein
MNLLTAAEIRAVGPIDEAADRLWTDVLSVAARVHSSEGVERAWAWQHLLLAVANFKAPLKVYPASLPKVSAEQPRRRPTLEFPADDGLEEELPAGAVMDHPLFPVVWPASA